MKSFIIICLFFSPFFASQAQTQEYIVSLGSSIPLGSYAGKKYNAGDGFATTQGYINVEFLHEIRSISPFGFFMNFSYQRHNIDDFTLAQSIKSQNPTIASLILDLCNYSSIMGTFGTYYRIDLSEKWAVNLKVGIGAISTYIDPITVEYQTYTDDRERIAIDTQGEVSFTYYAGLNTEYKFSEKIGIALNVFHSSSNSTIGLKDIPDSREIHQRVQFLNVGLGITIYN